MKKEKQIIIRLTDEEKADFERAAEVSGISMSAWARQKLRSAAMIELQSVGETPAFLTPAKPKETN